MLRIRGKLCNTELEGPPTKTKCCGCDNLTTIKDSKVTALDLSQVIMLNSIKEDKKTSILSSSDLAYQEARRQRKVRRLDFDVR